MRGAMTRLGADLFRKLLSDMGYEGNAEGDNWMHLALLHIEKEEYEKALTDARRMIDAFEAAGTPSGYAYELLAWCIEEVGGYDEARAAYHSAKKAYEQAGEEVPASVYYAIAWYQHDAGDDEAALPNFERAATIYRASGEPVDPYIYYCLATIYYEKRNSGVSEGFAQLALDGYRQQLAQAEAGATPDISDYFYLAELYNITGRNAEALAHYLRVEELMKAENREISGYLCDVIGWYQKDAGDNAKALAYYRLALQTYLEEGDSAGDSYFWFAERCEELGELSEALESYERAVAEYEKFGTSSDNELQARLRRDALRTQLGK